MSIFCVFVVQCSFVSLFLRRAVFSSSCLAFTVLSALLRPVGSYSGGRLSVFLRPRWLCRAQRRLAAIFFRAAGAFFRPLFLASLQVEHFLFAVQQRSCRIESINQILQTCPIYTNVRPLVESHAGTSFSCHQQRCLIYHISSYMVEGSDQLVNTQKKRSTGHFARGLGVTGPTRFSFHHCAASVGRSSFSAFLLHF